MLDNEEMSWDSNISLVEAYNDVNAMSEQERKVRVFKIKFVGKTLVFHIKPNLLDILI